MQTIPLSPGGKSVIITGAVLTFLATLWMVLRFYSRFMKRTQIYTEDWMVLIALVNYYVVVAVISTMVLTGGVGHHVSELQPEDLVRLMKYSLPLNSFYVGALGLVKCSICLTLARILYMQPYRVAAYVALSFAIAWSISAFIVGLVICRPIAAFWDPNLKGGHCGDLVTAFAIIGWLDVALDSFILVLPLPMVWNLKVPRANKIGVFLIFALSIITITAGILRAKAVTETKLNDISYYFIFPDIFCVAEVGLAIIISSSAVIRPVFDRIFHGIRSISKPSTEVSKASETQPTAKRAAPSILDRRWSELMANSDVELQHHDLELQQHNFELQQHDLERQSID